jgi:hypothetical protein
MNHPTNRNSPQEVLLLQTLLDRDFETDSLGTQLLGILKANLGWIYAAWCAPPPTTARMRAQAVRRPRAPPRPADCLGCGAWRAAAAWGRPAGRPGA